MDRPATVASPVALRASVLLAFDTESNEPALISKIHAFTVSQLLTPESRSAEALHCPSLKFN